MDWQRAGIPGITRDRDEKENMHRGRLAYLGVVRACKQLYRGFASILDMWKWLGTGLAYLG